MLTCNNTAARRLGKEVSELISREAQNALSPHAPAKVIKFRLDRIRSVVSTGKPIFFEDERAGVVFQTSAYPVFDRNGKVVNVAVFARDITEQRRAEEALKEAKLRYQTLFEHVPIGISITTTEGLILEANRTMLEMIGRHKSDIGRISTRDVYRSLQRRRELLDQLAESSTVRDFKAQFKRKDDSFFDVSATITTLRLADQEVILAAVQDVTEREKMQAALQESEAMLRAVFDATTESILLVDKNLAVLACNKMAAHRLGIKPEELAGLSGKEIVKRQSLSPHTVIRSRFQNVRRLFQSGKPFRRRRAEWYNL